MYHKGKKTPFDVELISNITIVHGFIRILNIIAMNLLLKTVDTFSK